MPTKTPADELNALFNAMPRQEKWDNRYLDLAQHVGRWSKDPNAGVGAVIVNQSLGRIVATGFNGLPSNVEDRAERLHDKTVKLDMIIHAEQNALLYAGREARGCDAYVIGKPVCNRCAILLIQAGIRRVVAAEPYPGTDSYWDKVGILAVDMLKEAGVEFVPITDAQLDRLGLDRRRSKSAGPEQGDLFAPPPGTDPLG